jgi:hypothetical protein
VSRTAPARVWADARFDVRRQTAAEKNSDFVIVVIALLCT